MRERKDIDRLKSEMEELFADLCQVPRLAARRSGFRPAVDAYRTDDPPAVNVVVELAGVDPATVELSLEEGVLLVRGERRRERERRLYQHIELDYGPFERRIALAETVDADAAEATYERGLLTIRLPVAQARKAGPVRVKVGRREA
jgi:HSP20 family protein